MKLTVKHATFLCSSCKVSGFEWSDDIEEKTVRSLLEINAPVALLSYMRPYISGITSGSGYPPLVIPLLNFKANEVIYI